MKTITTREYDAAGRLLREVTVTEDAPDRTFPGLYPSVQCTCTAWSGVVPPPPCPVHGRSQFVQITCSADTTAAQAVVNALRQAEFLHG